VIGYPSGQQLNEKENERKIAAGKTNRK